MIKKIAVITGATSKIMDLLIDKLIDVGFYIVAISRKEKKDELRKNIKWVVCDLTSPNQDFSFLKDSEIIFHAASVSNFYTRQDYMQNNFQSTINLTDAALKYGVGKIVYVSSILAGYEYGFYGLSKIKSEEYITEKFNNWLIIRPSQLYGYSIKNPIDKLIRTINKNGVVVLCPVGDKKSIYPLYFKDLVKIIYESSILHEESNIIKKAIGSNAYNYKSLIKEIAKSLNKKMIIIPVPKFIVQSTYLFIKFFKLKIGIYPDQLYRFYHNNKSKTKFNGELLSITDYIRKQRSF